MMNGTLTATCDRELVSGTPDWVHLFPPGEMTGRDGRQFNLADPQAVIAAFQEDAIDLPVDYEHQNDSNTKDRSGPVPAAGWIKELKADATGLWGRVEWTAQARELIASKAYRYLSPSFVYAKTGKAITRLKGAGLVHNPALHLKALASQEEDDMSDKTGFLERLKILLGLPEDSTEDAVFDRLNTLVEGVDARAEAAQTPDPARFVPIEVVQGLLKDRRAEMHSLFEERAQAKVTKAVKEGFITPGMRDWATALCTSDAGSFDTFLSGVGPTFAHLFEEQVPAGAPPSTANVIQSDTAATVCSQLGLAPGTLQE